MVNTANNALNRNLWLGAGVAVALGVVAEVPVRPNQAVITGDLLVALDDYSFQLAVAEAEAALEQARQDAQYYLRQVQRNEKMSAQVWIDTSTSGAMTAHSGRSALSAEQPIAQQRE